jgi:dTDP-glucose pyrophosphorylase
MYSPAIWEVAASIGRSPRGELEISDANKEMIRKGIVDTYEICGWWSDAGTQESFRKTNIEIWDNLCPRLAARINNMAAACRGERE